MFEMQINSYYDLKSNQLYQERENQKSRKSDDNLMLRELEVMAK